MKNSKTIVAFLAFLLFLQSCAESNEITLEEANQVYFQMKPELAYQHYEKIWSDSGYSSEDKAESGRNMAKMTWLLYDKPDEASNILEAVMGYEFRKYQTYLLWSRILTDQKEHDQAIARASEAVTISQSSSELYTSKIGFVKAVLMKYQQAILNGNCNKDCKNSEEISQAYSMISEIMNNSPGDILAAKLYLGLSLILKENEAVYEAWRSYFRANTDQSIHPTLSMSDQLLQSGLSDSVKSQESVEKVTLGLRESGFIDYAVMNIKLNPQFAFVSSEISDLIEYQRFLDSVKDHTLKFYRDEVIDDSSEKEFESALENEAKILWNKWNWLTKKPSFNREKFKNELRKRFNVIVKFMNANGHYGIHYGHIVIDEERSVEQHGKSARLNYISLDHILSNGYSSWFWDGSAEIGGWAPSEESILQIRSAYSQGPISSWLQISDSVKRDYTIKKIKRLEASDDSIALGKKVAYLPGMTERIRFNVVDKIYQSLIKEGYRGSALQQEFIEKITNLELEYSIFNHEGRHSIDKKYDPGLRSAEMEFRAKLSEVYFAEEPFLALRAVLSENIGDETTHGEANYRVLEGIVKWMEGNENRIDGYETDRPALPQLDLLTEEQLKTAVLTLDPYVN